MEDKETKKILCISALVIFCLFLILHYKDVVVVAEYFYSQHTIGVNILLVIAVFSLICALILYFIRSYISYAIKKYSKKYSEIITLNNKCIFPEVLEPVSYTRNVESKKAFDRFDLDNYLYGVIRDNFEEISEIYKRNIDYRKKYEDYLSEFGNILSGDSTDSAKQAKMPLSIFLFNENELIQANRIQKPYSDTMILCNVKYVSEKGKSRHFRNKSYTPEEVKDAIDNLSEYTKKKSWVDPQYERELMTDNLRYNILKRDGFKCQICGFGQKDGVKLHVDHIIPVSKGGRTVPSNLRTLCEACNMGKSAKYDMKGNN